MFQAHFSFLLGYHCIEFFYTCVVSDLHYFLEQLHNIITSQASGDSHFTLLTLKSPKCEMLYHKCMHPQEVSVLHFTVSVVQKNYLCGIRFLI